MSEPAVAADNGTAPTSTPPTAERPEVVVGAAFAGGLLAALILRRLGARR